MSPLSVPSSSGKSLQRITGFERLTITRLSVPSSSGKSLQRQPQSSFMALTDRLSVPSSSGRSLQRLRLTSCQLIRSYLSVPSSSGRSLQPLAMSNRINSLQVVLTRILRNSLNCAKIAEVCEKFSAMCHLHHLENVSAEIAKLAFFAPSPDRRRRREYAAPNHSPNLCQSLQRLFLQLLC